MARARTPRSVMAMRPKRPSQDAGRTDRGDTGRPTSAGGDRVILAQARGSRPTCVIVAARGSCDDPRSPAESMPVRQRAGFAGLRSARQPRRPFSSAGNEDPRAKLARPMMPSSRSQAAKALPAGSAPGSASASDRGYRRSSSRSLSSSGRPYWETALYRASTMLVAASEIVCHRGSPYLRRSCRRFRRRPRGASLQGRRCAAGNPGVRRGFCDRKKGR